jgi:transposase-like protein
LARHAYNCGDDPSFHARVDAYARRFGIARESVLRWVDRRMADSGIWFGDPDIVPGGGAR